jgi:hypothetical protein
MQPRWQGLARTHAVMKPQTRHARASSNAVLDPRVTGHLLVANSASLSLVGKRFACGHPRRRRRLALFDILSVRLSVPSEILVM